MKSRTTNGETNIVDPITGEPKGPYFVAVYVVDKFFGGPEEGGWWYDGGRLVRVVYMHRIERCAFKFASRMDRLLNVTLNKNRRSISSVLSTGEYRAEVYQGIPPDHFPETRPHYE